MAATVQPEGETAEVEFVVFADDTVTGNIEDQLAYLNEDAALEEAQEFSMRILQHYAASVRHRKYYGIDVVAVRVSK